MVLSIGVTRRIKANRSEAFLVALLIRVNKSKSAMGGLAWTANRWNSPELMCMSQTIGGMAHFKAVLKVRECCSKSYRRFMIAFPCGPGGLR